MATAIQVEMSNPNQTALLSDTTDAGSLTSAPDPYTFSIFPSYITVITPAPYNEKNVKETETASADQTVATSGTSASADAGTKAGQGTSETRKGDGSNFVSPISVSSSLLGLVMYAIASALAGAAFIL